VTRLQSYVLGVFAIVLAIVLAIFSYPTLVVGSPKVTVTDTSTQTITETTQGLNLNNQGTLDIQGVGNFSYDLAPPPQGFGLTAVMIDNTTFSPTTITLNGQTCLEYNIMFSDGQTQSFPACSSNISSGIVFQFTQHVNPQAGLIYFTNSSKIYLLVSVQDK
jgi:hypothetical protein